MSRPSSQTTWAQIKDIIKHLDKAEQRSDWGARPLRPNQISYAASDAAVLLRLLARLR